MIINQIKLLSFGKFKNRNIQFTKGLNVIFGNNEAGKSTLHKFIEGLLYGFNQKSSNKEMNQEQDKFKPWKDSEYQGELTYSSDNHLYRIFRDFNENKVSVFDEENGNDISEDFIYNKKLKAIEPGKTIFGINKKVFSNTFSINQLGSRTDEELLYEVKEKIENITKSKDENIRIRNVYGDLDRMAKDLGNADDLSSEYGSLSYKINSLKKEIKQREELNLKFNRKLILIEIYRKQLMKNKTELENTSNIISELDSGDLKTNYERALELSREIESLNLEIGNSETDLDINIEEYEKLIKMMSRLEQLETQEVILNKELNELNNDVEDARRNYFIQSKSSEFGKLDANYELFQSNNKLTDRLEAKINDINKDISIFEDKNHENIFMSYEKFNANYRKMKFLKSMLESDILVVLGIKLRKVKNIRITNLLFSVILIGLIILGTYTAVNYFSNNLYFAALITMLLPLFSLVDISRNTRMIKLLKKEMADISAEKTTYQDELSICNEENTKILINTECTNLNELKSKYNIAITEINSIKEKRNTLETLEEEFSYIKRKNDEIESSLLDNVGMFGYKELNDSIIDDVKGKIEESNIKFVKLTDNEKHIFDLEQKLKEIVEEKENSVSIINDVFEKNNVKSTDELKLHIKEHKNSQEKIIQRKNKVEILNSLLGKYSLEEMKAKIDKIEELLSNSDFSTKEEIFNKHDENSKEVINLEEKIKRLMDNLSIEKKDVRILSEIEEELQYYKNKKDELDKKLENIIKTNEYIHKVSLTIQEEFVPKLNRKINHYLGIITNGKYDEAIIDEDLTLSVFDKDNKLKVSIDSLSAGTIDQIFFSVRFALIDIISIDKDAPVTLDDCFTQYDEPRLKNAMKILSEIAKNRQILLFTCHTRENEMLEKMGTQYNYIEL